MKPSMLKLKPAQLQTACDAWEHGGCQTLGHWLMQSGLGRDYYSELVGLVRAKLGDTTDYSEETHDHRADVADC